MRDAEKRLPRDATHVATHVATPAASPPLPRGTYARRGVRLPEEAVVQLHTRDFGLSLELIARVALEGDSVSRLPAVAVAGAVLRHSRVVAGGCDGRCKDKTTAGHTWDARRALWPGAAHRPPARGRARQPAPALRLLGTDAGGSLSQTRPVTKRQGVASCCS